MHGAKSKHYNAQQILQKLPLCEAAPERELAQESKALLQQRSRMLLEAVRSEVDIFHSKYCKSYPCLQFLRGSKEEAKIYVDDL